MVFFQYDSFLAWAIIDRRPSKRDSTRDVFEKVTLIEDIEFTYPDEAHVEILYNFSFRRVMSSVPVPKFPPISSGVAENSWQICPFRTQAASICKTSL